jgi:hypothetical protein
MFFLLRIAFWLTLVLVLLPSGSGSQQSAQAKVGATDAMVAAGAAVSDMSGFCDRQPDACVVGAQAAAAIGQRAQAGARMVYDFVSDRLDRPSGNGETGSVTVHKVAAVRTVPASPGSQTTLTPSDLEPAWQGPPSRAENVPMPRPRRAPHHKA